MRNLRIISLLATAVFSSVCCSGCGEQPVDPNLSKIAVTTQPNKTTYYVGEKFNPDGMKITATYNDGQKKTVTDYKYSPDGALKLEDSKINITYYGKETYTTIKVKEKGGGGDGYYAGIDENSDTLLQDLHSLNSSKRKRTVGKKQMLTDPEHGFYVTDPGNGPKTITSFYSGKSINGTTGLNREHVWPDSRGGNSVENDIHMLRPTLDKENGNRGNSFYVEGKCSSSSGWDPAATDFGKEDYRGDSARIIFYCCIANTDLKLIDAENDSTSHKTMGKLSDLLKWNLKYEVKDREMVRNDGAQELQGNRNPFIDHPEYACKIWGTYNAECRRICGM